MNLGMLLLLMYAIVLPLTSGMLIPLFIGATSRLFTYGYAVDLIAMVLSGILIPFGLVAGAALFVEVWRELKGQREGSEVA